MGEGFGEGGDENVREERGGGWEVDLREDLLVWVGFW